MTNKENQNKEPTFSELVKNAKEILKNGTDEQKINTRHFLMIADSVKRSSHTNKTKEYERRKNKKDIRRR